MSFINALPGWMKFLGVILAPGVIRHLGDNIQGSIEALAQALGSRGQQEQEEQEDEGTEGGGLLSLLKSFMEKGESPVAFDEETTSTRLDPEEEAKKREIAREARLSRQAPHVPFDQEVRAVSAVEVSTPSQLKADKEKALKSAREEQNNAISALGAAKSRLARTQAEAEAAETLAASVQQEGVSLEVAALKVEFEEKGKAALRLADTLLKQVEAVSTRLESAAKRRREAEEDLAALRAVIAAQTEAKGMPQAMAEAALEQFGQEVKTAYGVDLNENGDVSAS